MPPFRFFRLGEYRGALKEPPQDLFFKRGAVSEARAAQNRLTQYGLIVGREAGIAADLFAKSVYEAHAATPSFP
ncbi:hypothetical protein CFR73_15870 [Novacetimonas maltaceti]|nr:hypothetical protein CFR73_15870 [Novacetimonas maltaceti]